MSQSESSQSVKLAKVSEHVIYTDPQGLDHDALVTAVWGPLCVNLVFVSGDDKKTDMYGRQIETRPTSVSHQSGQGTAHGRTWRFPDEEKKPYSPPLSV